MRSFTVIAGLAASANAYAYGYPAYNATESSAAPIYDVVSSSVAAYPAVSSPTAYPTSSAPAEYTTKVITGLTTVCPEPTTITYAGSTYTITSSTTLVVSDCVTTTTMPMVQSTPAAVKTSSAAPVKGSSAPVIPPVALTVVPYPSKNGTAPTYPVATGTPSSTKPAAPQFTGAAAHQTGAAVLAVVGMAAAGIFGF